MLFTVPEGPDLDARSAGSLDIYEGHDDVEDSRVGRLSEAPIEEGLTAAEA